MKPLLIVDGYNVIGAWSAPEKNHWTMDEARDRLAHLLEDYCGYSGEEVVLVFDGWQSDRRNTTQEDRGDLKIVFTRRGETADSYIERLAAQTPRYRTIRVATSDGLEQSQVLSTGAVRMTSRELLRELQSARTAGMNEYRQEKRLQRNSLQGRLPEEMVRILEDMRRGDEKGNHKR